MEMGTNNSRKGFLATLMYPATQSSCTGHRHSFCFWFCFLKGKKKLKSPPKKKKNQQPFHLCACPSPINWEL